jgi:hypothetical protein
MSDFTQDPRLTLIGAGFVGDREAEDGVHLRWSFDPDLGFPPEGFRLFVREPVRKTTLKASFTALARQLQQQPAPAGVESGVTVHRADGDRLAVGTRCDQVGLDLGALPLVLRFRANFGAAATLVREVTVMGVALQGGVFVRALHRGRPTDCAAVGQGACLAQVIDTGLSSKLSRLAGGERLLAGRDLRARARAGRTNWAKLVASDRAAATAGLAALGETRAVAVACVPFQIVVNADAIDAIEVSGCNATLIGVVWSPLAPDEGTRGWKPLAGPICLPVKETPGYPCGLGPADPRDVAAGRLPKESQLPPDAPRRDALEKRLLGAAFDELRVTLEQALGAGGQFLKRLASDDPDDGTSWRFDAVRDVLTAAADPYFARLVGLYHVHRLDPKTDRFDYKVEATWPIDGVKRTFCWVVFDRGMEVQPVLPAPTAVAATSVPGSAHVDPDGVVNPFEMDVNVNWRRPSACESNDPVRTPIAYLVERTTSGAPSTGPYDLVTRRAFEAGAEAEVVPAMIADSDEGPLRFATGYFVDRGPGYGLFHYRVLGRDLFGRTSGPSNAAAVNVTDQVAPGPPLNLAAEYFDPDDPDRADSAVLAWANRDTPASAPRRAAVAARWVWPDSRRLQFPDLDEFRVYFRGGSLNHVLGHIVGVVDLGSGSYQVTTDLSPVGPDVPAPQTAIDLGALRNEGEEYTVVTVTTTVAGRLAFQVRANPVAPPLVGPCAFRLGRGTSPTATQAGRAPYAAYRTFDEPAHWGGFFRDDTVPSPPLRIAADGSVRGPLPTGLGATDLDVTRVLETVDGDVHWHYLLQLRGLTLAPTAERPRAVGTFGIGAVDLVGNAGRIAAPAAILAIHRTVPVVPPIVYPPVNYATRADYHGTSWFVVTWTGVAGTGYLVYRAGDLDLLHAGGIDPAVHRSRSADEQRLELQQLALDPAHIEAFRVVTATPVPGVAGSMQHRDPLPGALSNRFVYRLRAVSPGGTLAPWPPVADASCVVVDLPGVPPSTPTWADVAFPPGGVALRWVPNAGPPLAGYRLYRSDDADAASDVRSMTPLFSSAQDEGGGRVVGVTVTRDATGAIDAVTELAAGQRPSGRLAQYVDADVVAGRPVYYRLVAEDQGGIRSAASERLVVTAPKTTPPAPPDWGLVAVTPGQVALQWLAAEADLECLVLRRAAAGLSRPLGPWGSPGDYALVDTAVEAGVAYEYRVRVRDRIGQLADGPVLPVTAI